MSTWHTIAEAQREKHQLQVEIARQRRGIDRDLKKLAGEGKRLTSWKTYVARFPAQMLAAMFGVGLIAGSGWRNTSWRKQAGQWLFNAGLAGAKAITWSDLLALWSAVSSSFGKQPPSETE